MVADETVDARPPALRGRPSRSALAPSKSREDGTTSWKAGMIPAPVLLCPRYSGAREWPPFRPASGSARARSARGPGQGASGRALRCFSSHRGMRSHWPPPLPAAVRLSEFVSRLRNTTAAQGSALRARGNCSTKGAEASLVRSHEQAELDVDMMHKVQEFELVFGSGPSPEGPHGRHLQAALIAIKGFADINITKLQDDCSLEVVFRTMTKRHASKYSGFARTPIVIADAMYADMGKHERVSDLTLRPPDGWHPPLLTLCPLHRSRSVRLVASGAIDTGSAHRLQNMPRGQRSKEAPFPSPETSSRRRSATNSAFTEERVSYARVDDDMVISPPPGPSKPSIQSQPANGHSPYVGARPTDRISVPETSSTSRAYEPSLTPALSASRGLAYPNASPPTSFSSPSRNVSQAYQSRSIPQQQFPNQPYVQHRRSTPSTPPVRLPYLPPSSRGSTSPSAAHSVLPGPSRYGATSSSDAGGRPGHTRFSGPELAPLTGRGPASAGPSRPRDSSTRLPPITTLLYSNDYTPPSVPPSLPRKRVSIPELMNDPPTASTDSPLQPVTPASARPAQHQSSKKDPIRPEFRPHDPFAKKVLETEFEDGPPARLWPPITEEERQHWRATRSQKPRRSSTAAPVEPPIPDEGNVLPPETPSAPPRLARNIPSIPWHRVEYDSEFLQVVKQRLALTWRRFKRPSEDFPHLRTTDGLRFTVLDVLHYLYFAQRHPKSSGAAPPPQAEPGTRMPYIKPEPDLDDDHTLLHSHDPPRPPNKDEYFFWLGALVYLPRDARRQLDLATYPTSTRNLQYNPAQRRQPHELLRESLLMWCFDILVRADLSDRALTAIIVYLVCLEPAIREDLAQAVHTKAMRIRSPPLSSCQIALVACCSLATKFEEEKPYSLKAWSRITTLTLLDLLECEQHIFSTLKWNAWSLSLVKGIFGITLQYPTDDLPPLPSDIPPVKQEEPAQ
ncbi:hypothetical protein CALCODRAFT_506738 [Calocera cornea HHB12733]|uniref:Cyclin N-terminal domain-containing protein n=1 Tax=Calocera cornea HHB12733 TaxID=1353952 RepID=A0A165IJI4_9BASI|nr:hypothetical protein CALCODRAFT_506738 [Calocera cornea HHB12733]